LPDAPPLAPDDPAIIAAELMIAWRKLGGRADDAPAVLNDVASLYEALSSVRAPDHGIR
jgi:hypothetical protein